MSTYQNFQTDQKGSAAVEFAILAPLFLILLAGIINIGLAINWKLAAEARVSSLSNLAVTSDIDFNDQQAAIAFLEQAKSLFSQSPIQPYSSEHENLTINLNNSIELTISDGQGLQTNSGGPLETCYCPIKSASNIIWGNQYDCDETCPSGQTAAHYMTVIAENESPLTLISGQDFSIANVQFTSLVRLD